MNNKMREEKLDCKLRKPLPKIKVLSNSNWQLQGGSATGGCPPQSKDSRCSC